ncbi:MAG: hypothetical protein JO202_17045 [Ktedonobacteraceae bacterium]|nr:hypothetical protein [Ktedonobacteraceae bacterium]
MRRLHGKYTLLSVSACSLLLAFILAACGSSNSTAGGSSSSPPPTVVQGYGTAHGCPSDSVVGTTSTPNVTVKPTDAKSTVMAHVGNVIAFQFPFGQRWSGPTTSQGNLQLQQPAGYAVKAAQVCVWRFVAKGIGTTQLDFHSQALCKPGQFCPQHIVDLPFTVKVS